MHDTTTRFAILMTAALVATAGCSAEIDVHEEGPAEAVSPLVGAWEWREEVSHLEVDDALQATQTSSFDNLDASPSQYSMSPLNDGTLVLEGWLANAPCDAGVLCDEGRAYQRHHMSYYVDGELFLPFAMLRKSGSPGVVGGAGAGVFEAFGVEETRLEEGVEAFRVVETRWRLDLDPSGSYSSTTERLSEGLTAETEATAGTWTLASDGRLTLHDQSGADDKQTLWRGDVVALDGLVFTRDER